MTFFVLKIRGLVGSVSTGNCKKTFRGKQIEQDLHLLIANNNSDKLQYIHKTTLYFP